MRKNKKSLGLGVIYLIYTYSLYIKTFAGKNSSTSFRFGLIQQFPLRSFISLNEVAEIQSNKCNNFLITHRNTSLVLTF